MNVNLTGKSFCVFGLPDSGKSTLVNFILHQFGRTAFIYDTLHEFPADPFDSYEPDGRMSALELERTIRLVIKARKYKLFVIDEANRFCPSKPKPLPQAVADLNDWRAHYDLGAGFVCRRPTQLNQDLTELAHYLFIFRLPGKNDRDYLNNLSTGLGGAAARLPKYHFLTVDPERNYTVTTPVPRKFATDKKSRSPRGA